MVKICAAGASYESLDADQVVHFISRTLAKVARPIPACWRDMKKPSAPARCSRHPVRDLIQMMKKARISTRRTLPWAMAAIAG